MKPFKLNQNGTSLPITLFITLLIASILTTYATQLQSQSISANLYTTSLHLLWLEKQCLYDLVQEVSSPDFLMTAPKVTKWIYKEDGTSIYLTYLKGNNSIEVSYKIYYNEYTGKGSMTYDKKNNTYTYY